MEEFEIVGKIDLNKLGKYKNIVLTDKVILTNERKQHICEKHFKDYEKFDMYIKEILYSPNYILQDLQHDNTIVVLKELSEYDIRIKIVIKLTTDRQEKRYNSIITSWFIRKRDYQKAIEKSEKLYEKS